MRLRVHESTIYTDGGEELPNAVVQLAREAPPLFVPQRSHASVKHFQLLRLAMQLRKHFHFCPQQLWNNRNGKIVYSSVLISLQPVLVRHENPGDEDNR